MDKRVGVYKYKVESFHLDCTERLSLTVLGNQLLNAAARHAEEYGYGRETLRSRGQAWVFSRLLIEMKHYPREFDEYSICTWVDSASRFFSNRNFAVLDASGAAIGYASSVWAMIDLSTRQAVDIHAAQPDYAASIVCGEVPPCPVSRSGRARVESTEPVRTFSPLFCDIDYNGHFNSIKYIEHLLDALPMERLRQCPVGRFEISYSAECHYGEPLAIYRDETSANQFALELRKADGTVSSRAKVVLANEE